jgi:WD40 repeat protein
VITASRKTAQFWDVESGRSTGVLIGHDDWVASAAFSPDGRTIVTASDDKTVRLWDVDSGNQLAVLHGDTENKDSVWNATFSPDGKMVISAHFGKARLWDVRKGTQIEALTMDTFETLGRFGFSADGRTLVTARIYDHLAQTRDFKSNNAVRVFAGHDNDVRSAGLMRGAL